MSSAEGFKSGTQEANFLPKISQKVYVYQINNDDDPLAFV